MYERNANKIDAKKAGITDYEHSLSTVWEMSLNKLSGPSRYLQQNLTFFDPDNVDEMILQQGSQTIADVDPDLEFLTDEMDLFDAEESLLEAALINKTTETNQLSIHRLIQAAVTRKLSPEDRIKYFDVTIQMLCWGFPYTWSKDIGHQKQSWQKCEMCLPHVNHIVSQREKYQIRPTDPEKFAQLLLRCCWYLYERESYNVARKFIKAALDNFQENSNLAYASAVELLGLIEMDTNFQMKAIWMKHTPTTKKRSIFDLGLKATVLGIHTATWQVYFCAKVKPTKPRRCSKDVHHFEFSLMIPF